MNNGRGSKTEYIRRINKAISYIDDHLDQPIDLEILSNTASFSAFHFHRIFTGITGETPNQYLKRRRLEKAASMIGYTPLSNLSMLEIATECGFTSAASFSRAFKSHFGMSPTDWLENRKNCQLNSKQGKASESATSYDNPHQASNEEENEMNLELREIPEIRVAYVANLEGYSDEKVHAAWNRLLQWAGPRELLKSDTLMLGIPFDNPDITDPDKCRYYACIGIDDATETTGDVGNMKINAGRYAVHRFSGTSENILDTYRQIFTSWFPESGYQPTNEPFFERYLVDGSRIEEEMANDKVEMEICIPVKPL